MTKTIFDDGTRFDPVPLPQPSAMGLTVQITTDGDSHRSFDQQADWDVLAAEVNAAVVRVLTQRGRRIGNRDVMGVQVVQNPYVAEYQQVVPGIQAQHFNKEPICEPNPPAENGMDWGEAARMLQEPDAPNCNQTLFVIGESVTVRMGAGSISGYQNNDGKIVGLIPDTTGCMQLLVDFGGMFGQMLVRPEQVHGSLKDA